MFYLITNYFPNFSSARTLLATKSEKFKYRPGRMDLQLLFDPHRQGEFEREWTEARKARIDALRTEDKGYVTQLDAVEKTHSTNVKVIERDYDKTMRALIAKYGTVSPDEPIPVRQASISKSLGAAGEA